MSVIERAPKSVLTLLLAGGLGAAGFTGYEIGKKVSTPHPAARILGERMISHYVAPGEEVELLVSGRYGNPEHSLPFLTHFNINCTEPSLPRVHNPNPIVHSET